MLFRSRSVRIEQTIYVERESQRKIMLGKGGQTIKAIGVEARKEIAQMIEQPVHLFLFVKVRESWGEDPERYREMAQDEYLMRQITEEVLTGKVVDYLVDNAKINYVPAESMPGHEHAHVHGPGCDHDHAHEVEPPRPAEDPSSEKEEVTQGASKKSQGKKKTTKKE